MEWRGYGGTSPKETVCLHNRMSDDENDVTLEIENQGDIDYNPEFEQLLKENGDHAQVYSILHQMSHVKYRSLYDKCNIPLIVITAVIGFVTGIGLQYTYTNTALGAASVFVSIMKSIVSYLKLSERSENHRICSLQFAQISNEIKMELSQIRERPCSCLLLIEHSSLLCNQCNDAWSTNARNRFPIKNFSNRCTTHTSASSSPSGAGAPISAPHTCATRTRSA